MKAIQRARATCALALWLAAGTGVQAAGLLISQVADRTPDLAVFVTLPGAATPTASASSAAAGPRFSAALGSTPLTVKSAQPWDKSAGIALVVAIDVSASLGDAGFRALKQQLAAALTQLPPRSQVALLAIGSEVATIQRFGPASAAAGPALQQLTANAPETALYEGVLQAQDMAARAGPAQPLRRAVLVLTDGLDDSRRGVGREETLQKISTGGAPVYAMALAPSRPPPAQVEAIKSLAQIARASGGSFMQASMAQTSQALSHLVAQALQTQQLAVDCSACPRDGTLRALQISVQQGDLSTTDSREIRLMAPTPETAASGPASGASVPDAARPASAPPSGAAGLLRTARIPLAAWLGATALVIVLVAVLLWLRSRRRASPIVPPIANTSSDQTGDWGTAPRISPLVEPQDEDRPAETPIVDMPSEGKSIIVDVAGQGRLHIRVDGETVVGRSPEAHIRVARDSEASGKHAALYLEGNVLMLRDLGSSNGTFLNGSRILRPERLDEGDVLLVGRTELRVYLGHH